MPAVADGAVNYDFAGLGSQAADNFLRQDGNMTACWRFALCSQMLFYLGIGRKIVLFIFLMETLRVGSAVSASPLVLGRLLLVVALLLKRDQIYCLVLYFLLSEPGRRNSRYKVDYPAFSRQTRFTGLRKRRVSSNKRGIGFGLPEKLADFRGKRGGRFGAGERLQQLVIVVTARFGALE